jgi:coenzyme F420-reducing hydrogenase alpha subunit
MSGRFSWEIDRVAGESKVEVFLDNGMVRVTYGSLLSVRGFERLVVGRYVGDVPMIAARICGVCSHPHFWAAAIAAEQAAGIEVSDDVAKIRDICNKLGLLQNHVVHLGLLALPDYLSKEEVERVSRAVLAVNTDIVSAMKLLCGRLTSPNSYRLGRFFTRIDRRTIATALKHLKEVGKALEELIERALKIDIPSLRDPSPVGLSLSGSPAITVPKMGPYLLETPSGRTEIHSKNYKNVLVEASTDYSTSKKCVYNGKPFHVGARARLLNALKSGGLDSELKDVVSGYENLLEGNPFSNIYAKAFETKMVFDLLIRELDELDRELKLEPTYAGRISSSGIGVVEAPRGLLVHYYEVDEELRVTRADIVTPTVMNTQHIEASATALVGDLMASKASESSVKKLVEALVRAYDPCIPCAVHVIKTR